MVFRFLLEFLYFFIYFLCFFIYFYILSRVFGPLCQNTRNIQLNSSPRRPPGDSRGAKNKDFGPWPKTLKFGPNPSFIFYRRFLYFLGMVLYFYTMFLYFLGHLWSPRASWKPQEAPRGPQEGPGGHRRPQKATGGLQEALGDHRCPKKYKNMV